VAELSERPTYASKRSRQALETLSPQEQADVEKLQMKLIFSKRESSKAESTSLFEYSEQRLSEDIARIFPGRSFIVQSNGVTIDRTANESLASLTKILWRDLQYLPVNTVIDHREHLALQAFIRHRKRYSLLVSPQPSSIRLATLCDLRGLPLPEPPICWLLFDAEPQLTPQLLDECRNQLHRFYETQSALDLISLDKAIVPTAIDLKGLAHLSHDLRSPITSIRYILELFMDNELADEELHEYFGIAIRNCHWVSDIIDDILDYHKYQSGKLTAEREETQLQSLLESTVAVLAPMAKKKSLHLCFEQAEETASVHVDPKHLRRILGNLVTNACKYTDDGTISIKTLRSSENRLVIEVRDTGRGMSAEELSVAFDAFSRFQSGREEGVGLGLAVVRALCELSEIELTVSSEVGKGTCFSLGMKAQGWGPVKAPIQKLLLVDDDSDYLATCRKVLAAAGYTVVTASGVKEAIQYYRGEKFDAVLTDGAMEDGSAVDIVSAIRFDDLETPIVVASGDSRIEFVNELRAHGANAVLQKPLNLDSLREIFTDHDARLGLRRAA
jgi:signal transduction histidine kinase